LNEQLGSLLVDLAHQLSFYLDSSVLSLQIHYLLLIRSCKHKEIFNYYWHDTLKLSFVWVFVQKSYRFWRGITRVSEPCHQCTSGNSTISNSSYASVALCVALYKVARHFGIISE